MFKLRVLAVQKVLVPALILLTVCLHSIGHKSLTRGAFKSETQHSLPTARRMIAQTRAAVRHARDGTVHLQHQSQQSETAMQHASATFRSSAALPAAGAMCGVWQGDYIKLHKQMLEGSRPAYYLVSVLPDSGLADRLNGVITGFVMALLTGRAFQIAAPWGNLRGMEQAYDSPYINWTRDTDLQQITDNLVHNAEIAERYRTELGSQLGKFGFSELWTPFPPLISSEHQKVLYHSNLSLAIGASETVFVFADRGGTVRLFDNPYHRKQLIQLGMRPDTLHGCVMDFLFRPKRNILDSLAPTTARLPAAEGLTIGIQIRVGDHVFDSGGDPTSMMTQYRAFFRCAEELEKSFAVAGQQVVWLLISDSSALRSGAEQKYGEKLVVTQGLRLEHSSHSNTAKVSLDGFQASVAENWLFGMTDFQIVSDTSGYGRTAAMRSLQPNSVYMLSAQSSHACVPGTGTDIWQAAETFTGW